MKRHGGRLTHAAQEIRDTQGCPLRRVLSEGMKEIGGINKHELTVMSHKTDPFRRDTDGNQEAGRWFAEMIARCGLTGEPIHNRGVHYAITGLAPGDRIKPDGTPYQNNAADWKTLMEASKSARWLGHIPFDQITDERNDAPELRLFTPPNPQPDIDSDVNAYIPSADGLEPAIDVEDFVGVQPYHLVLVGEKSSLRKVLAPIAELYQADLYLPTGDISDTLVHTIAQECARDERPMRLLYFADCDPSGWNMGIVMARKLQAFKILLYPDMEFRGYRATLIPDQVREFDLPDSPLKETEARAGAWRAAMGVEQTEIDALATLQPDLLRQIARAAIDPFYDHTLDARVFSARSQWLSEAEELVDDRLRGHGLEDRRRSVEAKLDILREEIADLDDATREAMDGVESDLPEIVVPEPEPVADDRDPWVPLIDSSADYVEQTQRLIASRDYQPDEDGVIR